MSVWNFKDLTGQTFNRLTVIERAENAKDGKARWRCRCSCGNEVVVVGKYLRRGTIQSCGCLWREKVTTHGMSHTKIFGKWKTMLKRCENPKCVSYNNYGGRGIKVCERWHDFQNFYNDVSHLPHFGEKGYTLDRIDNDGDYEPCNVRWADYKTQRRNTRQNVFVEYQGVEMCLTDAAKLSNINYYTLRIRYYHGDRGERLFRPLRKRQK